MSDELVWAVTDGPSGTHAVALPEDDVGARRVARHHRGRFWCSREAGGCGGRLVVSVPDGGRPAFRHRADAACALARPGARAHRAYEHLRYQPALSAWLAGQGHRPRVEKVSGTEGSTDLLVVLPDVGSALEVQFSPLSDVSWRERDDGARAAVPHVTWLYGPAAEAAAATEAAVRGVSFSIRRHGPGLVVGVRDVEGRTRWVRLAACRLTADGLAAPGVDEARAVHARRTTARQEAARQAARRSRTAGRGLSPATPPWTSSLQPLPFPA